jgi:hypothetical protein
LGVVRVIGEEDARVRQVRAGANWATAVGGRWRARQVADLEGQGWTVTGLPLHRGWYGFVVIGGAPTPRLVALPPAFPAQPPRLLHLTPGGWVGTALKAREKRWRAYQVQDLLAESEAGG